MKKYDIITTHKSFVVESNAIVAPLVQLFGQLSEGEEPLAVIREDFDHKREDAQERWISVEDRLPVGDNLVLLHSRQHGVCEGNYYTVADRFIKSKYSLSIDDITHWMPLPTAPEGGEG